MAFADVVERTVVELCSDTEGRLEVIESSPALLNKLERLNPEAGQPFSVLADVVGESVLLREFVDPNEEIVFHVITAGV